MTLLGSNGKRVKAETEKIWTLYFMCLIEFFLEIIHFEGIEI